MGIGSLGNFPSQVLNEEVEKQEEFSAEKLWQSIDKVGMLQKPIVTDKFISLEETPDEVIEGVHRIRKDPNCSKEVIHCKDNLDKLTKKIHSHYRRRRSREETKGIFMEIAAELEKQMSKDKICAKIGEIVYPVYSSAYVSELLPDEYKDKTKIHPAQLVERPKTEIHPPKIILEELIEIESSDKSAEELSKLMKEKWGTPEEKGTKKETTKKDTKPKKLDPSFCEYWKKIDKIREELKNIGVILLRRLNECTFPKGCPNCLVNQENCLKDQKLLNELSYRLNQLSFQPSEI